MLTNLYDHDLERHGWATFDLIDEATAIGYGRTIAANRRMFPKNFISNDVKTEFEETCHYEIMDAPKLYGCVPQLFTLYATLPHALRELTGENVVPSPWHRSSVNANYYKPGDVCAKHVDSNPITVLISLTDRRTEQTWADHGTDYDWFWMPKPGGALMFHGKNTPHWVPPKDMTRITVPMNFYTEEDCFRPDWFDDYVYGNADYEDAKS